MASRQCFDPDLLSMSTLELFRIAARSSKHAKNHEEVRELWSEVQGDLDRAFSIVKP